MFKRGRRPKLTGIPLVDLNRLNFTEEFLAQFEVPATASKQAQTIVAEALGKDTVGFKWSHR